MANIPEPGLPDVAPQPLPTPYQSTAGVTPDAFGAAAGRSLDRVGGVAHDLYQQERQYADTAAVLGAEAQAKGALNKIILDDQTGYRSLRGADAVAGRDDALQKFQKAVTDAGSTLTSDRQRQHFEGLAQTIREEGFRWAIHHDVTEQEHLAIANFRGNVDQTMVTMENPAIVSDKVALGKQIDSLFQSGIEEARRRYGQGASRDAIASVVVPELQKAALGGMEAAVATQDPTVAKQAFDQLGKYMITNHQRFYAGVVEKLATRAAVDGNAGAVLRYAAESVPVPGGDPVMRIDGTKLAAALAALPSDSPHLAEIQKAIETRQVLLDKVWNANVGTIFARVESAALKGGPFDLSRAGVAPQDLEWLRVNAPGDLIKLQGQERKVDTAETKAASADARSDLSADMANPGRRDFYMGLTVPEFTKMTVDQGLGPADRDKALKLFTGMLQGAQSEKVNRTVAEQLAAALPTQKDQRDKLHGPLFDKTNEFIDQWKAAAEGKGPTTEQIRTFINHELVKGGPWYSRVRRILFETNPANAGTAFEPAGTDIAAPAPPVRAAPAGAVRVVAPDGSHGSVPAGSLDEALKQGYRRE